MKNSVFLIIGASSDIGMTLIENLLQQGENTIIAHYHSGNDKFFKFGEKNIVKIKSDLSDLNSVNYFIEEVKKTGHPTHIIHLPAVKINYLRFKDIVWDDFLYDFNIQVRSVFMILQEFLPYMAKNRYGKVVFMLSANTLNVPPKFLLSYNSIKYCLLGFMKSLASEYAHKNIRINGVSPTFVQTKFLENVNEKIIQGAVLSNPTKRTATVYEVVHAINFLLSDECSYTSGSNIPVTGGEIF